MNDLIDNYEKRGTFPSLSDLLIEAMRQEMNDRGLTQTDVSRSCFVDGSNLSRFLSGKRSLSLDALDRVTAYLRLAVVRRDDWQRREVIWKAWRAGELRKQWEGDWPTMRQETRP